MRLRSAFTLLTASAAIAAGAYATPEDARQMAEDGNVDGAITALQELLQYEPKNAAGRLLLGELAWSSGRDSLAVATLEEARAQGVREASLQLADMAIDCYNLPRARELVEAYNKAGKRKAGRRATPMDERAAETMERIGRMEQQLARVEKIVVIDSVNVDADDFLSAYRLSPESGTLTFEPATDERDARIVFRPQSGRSMIWAEADTAGTDRLMVADALYGDEWETARPLDDNLGGGSDVTDPFMMPDGITLYYASDNEQGLGGYDIWMARRGADGFLEPVNLGMPYNSPFNDYMMAIDEVTGVGWFASDRNRLPGQVTVYTFIPAEMRVTVDADDPAMAARALLRPISATQEPGADYSAKRQAARAEKTAGTSNRRDFELNVPGKGVLTSFSQVPEHARAAVKRYADAANRIAEAERQVAALRVVYARGDESVASEIRSIETALPRQRHDLTKLRNAAVKALL